MTAGQQIAAGAAAPAPAGPATLDLIRPAELPAEIALSPAEAARMQELLTRLLAALAAPEGRAAALRALLAALPAEGRPATIGPTGIPAPEAEVAVFDRYFHVRRVEGGPVAFVLLRGLVQTAAAVLSLAERGPDLPAEPMARQVAGFAASARLLGRVCGLERLP